MRILVGERAMLVRLTEISLFEDGVFENGEIEINFSDRQLLLVRKPKDPLGRSYTLLTFANGMEVAVRETPKQIAEKMEQKPMPVMLRQLQGYEKTREAIRIDPPRPKVVVEDYEDELVTNIRKL